MRPVPWGLHAARLQKVSVVFVRDFIFIDRERVDIDLVRGLVVETIPLDFRISIEQPLEVAAAHPEVAGRDGEHVGRLEQCYGRQYSEYKFHTNNSAIGSVGIKFDSPSGAL